MRGYKGIPPEVKPSYRSNKWLVKGVDLRVKSRSGRINIIAEAEMDLKTVWTWVQDNYGWLIAAIVTIQGFVEKSGKLAKKPLTALAHWVGSFFNAEIISAQKAIQKDLAELRAEVTANEQTQWRYQIIDFASRCQDGTKDQFVYAFYAVDKYYTANPNHNGEVKASVEFIQAQYKKALEGGKL